MLPSLPSFLRLFELPLAIAAGIMEEKFWEAAYVGDAVRLKNVLQSQGTVDINWRKKADGMRSPLHVSCWSGHEATTVLILACPGVEVNGKDTGGRTPFWWACNEGFLACVRLLLKDPRVMVNEPDREGCTPLRQAVHYKRHEIVRWWIASGREMDFGQPGISQTDIMGQAVRKKEDGMVRLLKRFKNNPEETRFEVRIGLCWHAEAAAEIFALVVFVSDGLLEIRNPDLATAEQASRFFFIATQLPLELQVVLCFRLVGSAKEVISGRDSEAAFQALAKLLL